MHIISRWCKDTNGHISFVEEEKNVKMKKKTLNKDTVKEIPASSTNANNSEQRTENNKVDEKIRHNLSTADRRLLLYHFGYIGGQQREATKKREEACLFVAKSLFNGGEDDQKNYNVEEEIDFSNLENTPGLFTRTKQEVYHFVSYSGLNSSDLQETATIRAFQVFTRVRSPQLRIGSNSKYLCLLALGKVCSIFLTCKRRE